MDNGLAAPQVIRPGAVSSARRASEVADAAAARAMRSAPPAESKAAKKLDSTSTLFNLPLNFEFFGLAGGWLIGRTMGLFGFHDAALKLRTNSVATISALRRMSWTELFTNPSVYKAHWHNAVYDHAERIASGTMLAKENVIPAAERRMAEAGARASELSHLIRPMEAARPVTAAASQGAAGTVASWHMSRNVANHAKHLGKATEALTQEPAGILSRIWNTVTFKKPATTGLMPELAGVARDLQHAETITCSAARANHMQKICGELSALTKGEAAVAAQATHVLRYATKANSAAGAAHGYAAAATEGFKGLGKMFLKAAGNRSIFGTLVIAGTAATVGAIGLRAHHVHAEDKATFERLSHVLGPEGHAYMNRVKAVDAKHLLSSMASTGVLAAGHIALGKSIVASQQASIGGGAEMAGMLPMFMNEATRNPVAAAVDTVLNQNAPKAQRVEAVKYVFAVNPSVVQHGGIYNRLSSYMANQVVNQGMAPEAILRLAANDDQFAHFSKEMSDKMKAEAAQHKAAPAKHEVNKAHTAKVKSAANDEHFTAKAANEPQFMTADTRYHAAEKPQMPSGKIESQGKLAEMHHAKMA